MSAVADPPGLRLRSLTPYLGRRLEDFDPGAPLGVELLAGGRSNVTYLLSQDDRRWVLRRPPLGNVMPSAHDMTREHRVLDGLTRAGYPVPRPLALCSDRDIIGADFLVMSYVDGRLLEDRRDTQALLPAEARALSETFVARLAELHAVDAASCGLSALGRPTGFLQRQLRRWTGQWERTKTRELAQLDELAAALGRRLAAVPEDLPWSIVHGDFRLDNLILDRDAPVVQAVLDWEMATLGYPPADLAVSLVYWSEPGDRLRRLVPVADRVTAVDGFASRRELVAAYARHAPDVALDHLDTCVALACLKLAVIMESIHKRTLAGRQLGQATKNGDDMKQAVGALTRMGTEVLAGGGLEALGR